ncbi:MAG: putative methyltransferase [Methanobrevibacter sp. CfCl-M3]
MNEIIINGKSKDILQDNINKLKELFPEILTEDKIDFNKLKTILSEEIDYSPERYNFTWHGKSKAIAEAQKPSTGTLRPVKKESKDWDTTQNLYIEGDNLEVLKLLQKSYYNKIKMIYIDPPYNTGNDIIYKNNYSDNLNNYLKMTGQITINSELGERERERERAMVLN